MALVVPKPTVSGYSAAWIVALTTDGTNITGTDGSAYKFNHVIKAVPLFAISEEDSAEASKIEKLAISGVTFEVDENTERRSILTGVEVGGSGGGGTPSKITIDSQSTHALDDIDKLQAMRGKVVFVVIPHGKSYKAGAVEAIKYYGLVGKITAITGPEFVGNDVAQISIEVTGGTAYISDAGDDSELVAAGALFTAIDPVGTDDADAGIAGPTIAAGAALTQARGGDIGIF